MIQSKDFKNKFLSLLKNNYHFIISAISLFAIGLVFTSGIHNTMDIRFWDETYYLNNGVNFFNKPITPDWGPFYSLWYFLLNLFFKDAIALYYTNFILLAILPAILIYLLLSQLNKNHIINYLLSFTYLISELNLPIWPKVSSFALVVIFISLIVLIKIKKNSNGYHIIFFSTLVLSYIRPEYFILIFPVFLLLVYNSFKYKSYLKLTLVTVVLFAAFILIGIPISSERSYVAFSQAFEKYLPISEKMSESGIKTTEQIMKENFGDAKSLTEIFSRNFNTAFKQFCYNFTHLPSHLFSLTELILPYSILRIKLNVRLVILLAILMILIITVLLKNKRQKRYSETKVNLLPLYFSLYLCIAPLISMILFFPRAHYLVLISPLIYILTGYLLGNIEINLSSKYSVGLLVIGSILSFVILPSSKIYFHETELTNKQLIYSLRNSNFQSRINLLENEGGVSAYLPKNFSSIIPDQSNLGYTDLLNKYQVNMILLTSHLINDSKLSLDSSWQSFLIDFERYGFVKRDIGNNKYLIKTNLFVK